MYETIKKLSKRMNATLFNVSMAIILFMPIGWAIIISILLLETILFYLILKRQVKFSTLFKYLTISNIVSGIIGFILSMIHNGGWYGVFWFPWVGSHETELLSKFFILYFIIIFVITLIIEVPINIFLFKRQNIEVKNTISISIIVNIITNVCCAFIIYLFSFGII